MEKFSSKDILRKIFIFDRVTYLFHTILEGLLITDNCQLGKKHKKN